jgi:hypothetical protein
MADEDASTTFRIALEDATSGPAASSAAALEALKGKIEQDVGALRGLQSALRNLKGGGVAADSAIGSLKDKIAAQKATIAGSQAGLLQLGASLERVKKSSIAADGGLHGLGAAFKAISEAQKAAPKGQAIEALREHVTGALGPMGRFIPMLKSATGAQLAMAAGAIALVAAIVAVAVATAAAAASLVKYGIATADARRSELLRLEGLAKIRNFWSGFAGTQKDAGKTASFLQEQIDRVSGSVAIGRDAVAGYAEELYRMGLRGGNLQAALEGVSITAATQGETQARAFAGWAAGAALTGQSVKALANDVKARLGGIAARQMLSLTVLSQKLHESFAMLFSGLKIDKLAAGVKMITDLFSLSTASGRALKAIVEALFPSLIDGAAGAAPIVKRFFQGMIIAALYLTIGILKVRNWIRDAFGKETIAKIDTTRIALAAGATVVLGLAFAFGVLALAVFGVTLPLLLLGYAFIKVIDLAAKAYDWFSSQDWASLGSSLVEGVVVGIANSASKVWDAMKRLANTAKDSFEKALGIHSPSTVMAKRGFFAGAGVALGFDSSRLLVRQSSRNMARDVEEATAPVRTGIGGYARAGDDSAPGRQGARAGAGAGGSVHFGDVHVHGANSEAEGRAAARGFRQELEETFMGVAAHLGARVPSPEAA